MHFGVSYMIQNYLVRGTPNMAINRFKKVTSSLNIRGCEKNHLVFLEIPYQIITAPRSELPLDEIAKQIQEGRRVSDFASRF